VQLVVQQSAVVLGLRDGGEVDRGVVGRPRPQGVEGRGGGGVEAGRLLVRLQTRLSDVVLVGRQFPHIAGQWGGVRWLLLLLRTGGRRAVPALVVCLALSIVISGGIVLQFLGLVLGVTGACIGGEDDGRVLCEGTRHRHVLVHVVHWVHSIARV